MEWTLISSFAAALFAIINPFGNLPIFISYTAGESKEVQRWLAVFIALTVLVFLVIFLISGSAILKFFGISLAAFRIAGGILLLLTGINMIRGQHNEQARELAAKAYTNHLQEAELVYRKILIPLGIPLFVGPGSISTVILYANEAKDFSTFSGLIGVIAAISTLVLIVLLIGNLIKRLLGQTGLDIATRIMGLLLTAIGVQFILSGLSDATLNFINPKVL
ncbi:MarC family protein [Kovacikia minuta CCNUW1]|uniref:MarC family protein n=1 Tax=Kovacikia minuta TaxID=2931930 RepID=UPI001CCD8607|nr:MarC family protein [Kovacikia minuta]UBF24959.1 MarC family protein [Kovacikia minuta CCNUW1]